MAKEVKAPKEKVTLTIAQVKEDLANGIDRPQMAKRYGVTKADISRMFKHPELKGLKVQREVEPGIILLGDDGQPVDFTSFAKKGAKEAKAEGDETATETAPENTESEVTASVEAAPQGQW